MFLHSGASLHGHEYSNRPDQPPAAAGQRRNTFLRSALAHTSTHQPPTTFAARRNSIVGQPETPRPRRTRPLSESNFRSFETAIVRFKEPDNDEIFLPARPEPLPATVAPPKAPPSPVPVVSPSPVAMSEDEASAGEISDSDISHAGSSVRRKARRTARKSNHYLLAQPPPKLRHKQRLLHTKPRLMLQLQYLCPRQRSRPIIDVYPSSALAKTVAAPFLRRFPRINRIKSELSIEDIMLVKSEDYSIGGTECEDECDEDSVKSRDLIAILSPLRTEENKVEIVLADGSSWVASARSSGPSCSFEFVSVDEAGNRRVARWIRRQGTNRPSSSASNGASPATPTSPSVSPALDYKYTFSLIDPDCRRHPILATLTSSSLEILDSYTTVSQSSNRYPPTSPYLASPVSAKSAGSDTRDRTTKPVEEWLKTFISVSAIWVALRDGRATTYRPASMIATGITPPPVTPSPVNEALGPRAMTLGAEYDKQVAPEDTRPKRWGFPPTSMRGESCTRSTSLPRRATSTGAAFIQRRRASLLGGSLDQPDHANQDLMAKHNRRTLSGGWTGSMANGIGTNESLNSMVIPSRTSSDIPRLAPAPLPSGRDGVPVVSPLCTSPDTVESSAMTSDWQLVDRPVNTMEKAGDDSPGDGTERRTRHQRWKSVTGWFKNLGTAR